VVGTVIDPEMGDELRVTVVATGLGQPRRAQEDKPMRLVVKEANGGELDYRDLERPTVMRNQAVTDRRAGLDDSNLEYLDVPAFLRRQAD
jgi:cell division protein FtsZ